MRPIFIIAAASVAAQLTVAGQAQAQANRTFVSGFGSDANPCTLSAPCRSFAQALTQTNAGGEITILDPAGYGTVVITKSVSIINDGVGEAGITTTSAIDGIDINIGANDVVNLRGLTLVGGAVGLEGIAFGKLGAINIQNCVVRGFVVNGIAFGPSGTAALNVSDTVISNSGNVGIVVSPSGSGTVTAAFNRVQAIGASVDGFLIDGSSATGGAVDVTIANSTVTNNGSAGVLVRSASGAALTQAMLSNSLVSNNDTGISAGGAPSTTYLARNTISGNSTAFTNSGGLFSFGDNDVKTNGTDGGAIPLVSTK